MNKFHNALWAGSAAIAFAAASIAVSSPQAMAAPAKAGKKAPMKAKGGARMMPLRLALPNPAFLGTPKNIKGTTAERPTGKPRPAFLVPAGTVNLSRGKTVTSSDPAPIIGSLDLVTNGNKEAEDGNWVELGPGTQWMQIDLGRTASIHAIVLWHYHGEARVYRDVVIRVSNDPDFVNATTIFNNDQDNTSGLGLGKDREFYETAEGKLINAKGVKGRYVRLYSRGNTSDDQNAYTEVEVYGK